MISLILYFTTLVLIIFCSGLVFSYFLVGKNVSKYDFFEISLLGIISHTFLTLLIHLFLPLDEYTNFIFSLILVSIALFIFKKEIINKINLEKIPIIISFVIVFIMTIKYKLNEDYGLYHLPYIVNFISEKVVFGLSNLQPQFAWNSTWLNFSATLNLPLMNLRGTQLSNSILYFLFLGLVLNRIFDKNEKNQLSYFFLVSLLFYIVIKYSRISEHGFDLPANLFLLISVYFFIRLFEKNSNFDKDLSLFFIFAIFSITIKLNTIVILINLFLLFLFLAKKKYQFTKVYKVIAFVSVFILLWFVQQFIYSSCFIPFLEITCIKSTEWFNPSLIESLKSLTGSVNKSYWQYKGDLSEEEFVKNFNWLTTWFNRNKIEIAENLLAILLPLTILIIINLNNLKKNTIKKLKYNKILNLYLLILISSGLLLWFFKSPVYRFGMPYIFTSIFFLIFKILKYYSNSFEINNKILYFFILSIMFNLGKNISRIIDSDFNENVWPKMINVEYSTKQIGEYYINYPNSKIKSTQHNLCWSIQFICDINKGTNIEIKKKGNYFIIIK